MGPTGVIGRHYRGREARPARGARPRPWAITIAVMVILLSAVLLSSIIGMTAYFLGSEWLAQHLDGVRWFVNEVKIWRPQLHP